MSIYNPMGNKCSRSFTIGNIGEMWVNRVYTGPCIDDIPRIKKQIESRYAWAEKHGEPKFKLVESKTMPGYWISSVHDEDSDNFKLELASRWKIPTEQRVKRVVLRFMSGKFYELDENMKPIASYKLADTKNVTLTEWFEYGFVRTQLSRIDEPKVIYYL